MGDGVRGPGGSGDVHKAAGVGAIDGEDAAAPAEAPAEAGGASGPASRPRPRSTGFQMGMLESSLVVPGEKAPAAAGKSQVSGMSSGMSAMTASQLPSRSVMEMRNAYRVSFDPPVTDEMEARRRFFGSTEVPDGLDLKKDGKDWVLTIKTDETKANDIRWDAYQGGVTQEMREQLYFNTPGNVLPHPDEDIEVGAKKPPSEPEFAKHVEVTGWRRTQVEMEGSEGAVLVSGSDYNVKFDAPKTQEQAAEFFFGQKTVPPGSTLVTLPKGAKPPTATWAVQTPDKRPGGTDTKLMKPDVQVVLEGKAEKAPQIVAKWIGKSTAAAINGGKMPPEGVGAKEVKPGVYVWKEGDGVFSYDKNKRDFQGFQKDKGKDIGSTTFNNYMTKYIEQGLPPNEAYRRTVADMKQNNIAIGTAFAAALIQGKAPEGGAELLVELAAEHILDAKGVGEVLAEDAKAAAEKKPRR